MSKGRNASKKVGNHWFTPSPKYTSSFIWHFKWDNMNIRWGKVWWARQIFSALAQWYWRCNTNNWFVTLLADFNKNSRVFSRISLLLADVSWKLVTRFLAESSSFLWQPPGNTGPIVADLARIENEMQVRDEHWTGLGLDWIRHVRNFVDFGLDRDCKMCHKVRIRTGVGLS